MNISCTVTDPPLQTLPLSKILQAMTLLTRALLCSQPVQTQQMFTDALSQPRAGLAQGPVVRSGSAPRLWQEVYPVGGVGTATLWCCSHVPRDSIPSRLEMHNFGVKVCVIEPGYFKTMITNVDNLEKNFYTSWQKLPEEIKTSYGEGYLKQCKYLPQRL